MLSAKVSSRIRPRRTSTPHGPNSNRIHEDKSKEIEELRGIYSLRLLSIPKRLQQTVKVEIHARARPLHGHVPQRSTATETERVLVSSDEHEDVCHKCHRRWEM